ncbi:MAG: Asp-tRNA(Asn)/Glu-tRNA(Gln) amidotransferase subunit GatC [Chloroflexi bacterium]|nr:Asp-tRNA(Asn)/Glu-tRNA(Gln) amidotransferase subunit GatC [Chloroflexota bacterium]
MRISKEEVRHIALLARMGMTEEDIERMQHQLSNILESFEVLKQVNTDDVHPTGHSVALDTVLREDEPRDSYSKEDILANAPHREADLFRVRAVLE